MFQKKKRNTVQVNYYLRYSLSVFILLMSDTKTTIEYDSRATIYRSFAYKKFAIPNKCFSNAVGIEIKQHNCFCRVFLFIFLV